MTTNNAKNMNNQLSPSDGAIVFIGTVNAMPMMYALEFRKLGFDVIYYVDVPASLTLHRPENHFPSISYPYPDWIVEAFVYPRVLAPLFPRLTMWYLLYKGRKALRGRRVQAVIMDGVYVAMASVVGNRITKIFLSFGDDLGRWTNVKFSENIYKDMGKRLSLRFLPNALRLNIIRWIICKNFIGAKNCRTLVCFPKGISGRGDVMADKLTNFGTEVLRRYDVSPAILEGIPNSPKAITDVSSSSRIIIINPARNYFVNKSNSPSFEGKGNDIAIIGFAKFVKMHRNSELHLFKKGPDTYAAQQLINSLNIQNMVVWHEEMPCRDLLELYVECDICFDQVGTHWLSAVGIYAMLLGRPLIANVNNLYPILGDDIPIMNASTPDAVYAALCRLSDPTLRQELADKAKVFAENNFYPAKLIGQIVK